ncbi:serine/threonine-protein kinase [Sphingomonas sp. ASY06-1R]|uniref:serine/threonine-protein kinase n=1 Tax=Sphingomonas sp. ASY06-1R TaxID=3445771 RepID=UPI003FA25A48
MTDRVEPTAIADQDPARGREAGREATLAAGDVLNGIYKVERFIARGGMGEVFEGVNIETDERVALKAIRRHLASDPKIVAMFRKEARVLTHISHPAIVQYRVFARDPLLDLYYIVTDFINGEPISAHLDGESPNISNVVTLARRLATGLEAAHDHGAIHRDMSPDNILFPEGRIERAKIIDFGIAKSLDITAETVVGEGFAGKLGYVAPEQFGDFGRLIGPWTDVYSTALVLLAYARGKAPAMGTTLSEAVERRRAVPDLGDIPTVLAPLIERMLVPDPQLRIRSMREVLAGLDAIRIPDDARLAPSITSPTEAPKVVRNDADSITTKSVPAAGAAPTASAATMTTFAPDLGRSERLSSPAKGDAEPSPTPAPGPPPRVGRTPPKSPPPPRSGHDGTTTGARRRRWTLVGVPILGAALVGAVFLSRTAEPPVTEESAIVTPASAPTVAASRLSAADRALRVDALLANSPCTWVRARPTDEDGPTVLVGTSGDIRAVKDLITRAGQPLGPIDDQQIIPANVTQCGTIEALRRFDTPGASEPGTLLISSNRLILGEGAPGCPNGAAIDLTAAGGDPARELALIALQPDGRLLQIAGSRAEFAQRARADATNFNIEPDQTLHARACYPVAGTGAVFLVDSMGKFDLGLQTGVAAPPPADFAQRLAVQGKKQDLRIAAEWARIEAGAPGAPGASLVPGPVTTDRQETSVAVAPSPPSTSRAKALASAAIATANANRQELERIRALNSGYPAKDEDRNTCRAFDGKWREVGQLSRSSCIAAAFRGRCDVTFARYRDRMFRRLNGTIEEQRGGRWRNVGDDKSC